MLKISLRVMSQFTNTRTNVLDIGSRYLNNSKNYFSITLPILTGLLLTFSVLVILCLCLWIFYTIWRQLLRHSTLSDTNEEGRVRVIENMLPLENTGINPNHVEVPLNSTEN